MMQWQSLEIWSTLRTSVPGINVTTKTGYLVNNISRVDLSVLVIWYIFTVFMSNAASASRMSSSGTFGGIPISTIRGWRVSRSGYVWYSNLAACISDRFLDCSLVLTLYTGGACSTWFLLPQEQTICCLPIVESMNCWWGNYILRLVGS
jgi:hypothetical protein